MGSIIDITTFNSDKTYDIIIIIGGLHHVPTFCEDAVKMLKKNLKPKGHFIVFEPTHYNYLFRKVREKIYKKTNSLINKRKRRLF